mgnify:CR=1 FL=1
MSIGITEFYKKVLPSKGTYCIATIDSSEKGRVKHYFTESIDEIEPKINDNNVDEENLKLGDALRTGLQLEIAEMDSNASRFFKRVYQNTPRIVGRKR